MLASNRAWRNEARLGKTYGRMNVPAMQQPEAYIGNAANLFDESGNLANDSIRGFAAKYIHAFAAWVETNTSGRKQ